MAFLVLLIQPRLSLLFSCTQLCWQLESSYIIEKQKQGSYIKYGVKYLQFSLKTQAHSGANSLKVLHRCVSAVSAHGGANR